MFQFSSLHLENFMSFENVTLDLNARKNKPKHLAILYSPNSGGKTSVALSLQFLPCSMETMQSRKMLTDLLENNIELPDDTPMKPEAVLKMFKNQLSRGSLENLIKRYRTINATAPTVIQYDFMLDGAAGSYRVEFDDQTLLSERLDYKLQKNRACYFDISADRTRLNKKVLISDDYEKTLQEQISQYWGKHTFLSILMYEQSDKAKSFFDSSLSPAFRALLTAFRQISTNERSLSVNADTQLYLPDNDYFFTNLTEGTIQNTQKKDLLAVEKILNRFIKSIYPDVNKAYYKLAERDGSQTDYRLLLNKRIGKNSIGISFTKESTGTRRLLDTLPYLLAASVGGCVVMDEFGNGIHDKLLVSLIQSFSEIIEGQLILMTNNTSLLESSVVPADSFYFIENDADFHKSIKCISDIETRLYKNYDYRNLYIKNSRYKTSSPSSMPDEAAILAMKTLCAGKTS